MSEPLVSVIIPTYNRDTYLYKAIESVATQDYKKVEIIVVDDGSKLNYAEEICNKFKNCTYFYKDNGGLSSARNYGVIKAKGEFISFLDDDDFWLRNKLQKQVKILVEDDEINLVHSAASVVDAHGKKTGKIIGASTGNEHKRSGRVFWNALGVWVVKSPTPLIRKSALENPDFLFDEKIKIGEDLDFYQRFFYLNKIYYFKEPLAFYRVYDDAKRLSTQREKYVGLEKKMFTNFKKMKGVKMLDIFKIKKRLAIMAVNNWNAAFPDKKLIVDRFFLNFYPSKYLDLYKKLE